MKNERRRRKRKRMKSDKNNIMFAVALPCVTVFIRITLYSINSCSYSGKVTTGKRERKCRPRTLEGIILVMIFFPRILLIFTYRRETNVYLYLSI